MSGLSNLVKRTCCRQYDQKIYSKLVYNSITADKWKIYRLNYLIANNKMTFDTSHNFILFSFRWILNNKTTALITWINLAISKRHVMVADMTQSIQKSFASGCHGDVHPIQKTSEIIYHFNFIWKGNNLVILFCFIPWIRGTHLFKCWKFTSI